MKRLDDEAIQRALDVLPGWKKHDGAISKTFDRKTFNGSIVFLNTLAELAERTDHHPDVDIRYNNVTVSLSTHDAGGITELDVSMARHVEAVSRE